jgi:hypothetical protein
MVGCQKLLPHGKSKLHCVLPSPSCVFPTAAVRCRHTQQEVLPMAALPPHPPHLLPREGSTLQDLGKNSTSSSSGVADAGWCLLHAVIFHWMTCSTMRRWQSQDGVYRGLPGTVSPEYTDFKDGKTYRANSPGFGSECYTSWSLFVGKRIHNNEHKISYDVENFARMKKRKHNKLNELWGIWPFLLRAL